MRSLLDGNGTGSRTRNLAAPARPLSCAGNMLSSFPAVKPNVARRSSKASSHGDSSTPQRRPSVARA